MDQINQSTPITMEQQTYTVLSGFEPKEDRSQILASEGVDFLIWPCGSSDHCHVFALDHKKIDLSLYFPQDFKTLPPPDGFVFDRTLDSFKLFASKMGWMMKKEFERPKFVRKNTFLTSPTE